MKAAMISLNGNAAGRLPTGTALDIQWQVPGVARLTGLVRERTWRQGSEQTAERRRDDRASTSLAAEWVKHLRTERRRQWRLEQLGFGITAAGGTAALYTLGSAAAGFISHWAAFGGWVARVLAS